MMEAVRTSETSVDNHFTRQYNPEDSSEDPFLLSATPIYQISNVGWLVCHHSVTHTHTHTHTNPQLIFFPTKFSMHFLSTGSTEYKVLFYVSISLPLLAQSVYDEYDHDSDLSISFPKI
jgi:hypothetical protein